ncbi:MAG: Gfo/Idh/MocA family oxidoreductase [Sedimentisphaerales bacterium]|nr:Gfo/Idh/MocA family oxidoreductase [Sedimentisphaerales bacterium]
MKRNSKIKDISRRGFLKATATAAAGAAFGVPYVITTSVHGADAPSKKITVGCIGTGRMGVIDLKEILGFEQTRVVALCDVDAKRLKHAQKIVEEQYGSQKEKDCAIYKDFRDIIARNDIDVISITSVDHWHALQAIAAVKAGKDVFLQKPLTLTVKEGRVLSDTVRRYGRILQVGIQQRSDEKFRFACELVRNGRIGKLRTVKVGIPEDLGTNVQPTMPVPENLDYDMWLGPTPVKPYTEARVHPQNDYSRPGWLRISDYCCGMITAWGVHHNDIAQWGMGTEYTGPAEIEGKAEYPKEGLWDVHGKFHIEYTYANGVKVICAGNSENKQGVVFEGTEGWIYVDRGFIDANPKSLLTSVIAPGEIRLYKSNDHKKNFFDCVKSRSEPAAPVEIGHRSTTMCILGYIAMLLGRKLKWDAEKERFLNDAEANRMLARPMRSPWSL